MTLFKELIFNDIDPSLRDFAIQPKTFEENRNILQKYYDNGGPSKSHSYLSFVYASMEYQSKSLYSNIHQKYNLLKNAMENKLSNNKDEYFASFCRAQKHYFAFSRLAYMFRFKRSIIRNQEDMMMMPIYETDKHVIIVYENGNKYLFRHSEILKICRTSLCHIYENDLEYIEPKPMKNPYTNIPFSKSTLFHMYCNIATNSYRIYRLFQTFFRCSFNLKELWNKHSPLIIEFAIKDFLNNAPIKTVSGLTLAMLDNINSSSDTNFKIIISSEFDRDILVTTMKPYLELYLHSFYNHNHLFSNRCLDELKYKLKVLYTKHPNFGKKLCVFTRNNKNFNKFDIQTQNVIYTEHNNFIYSSPLDNFEKSHYYSGFVDEIEFRLDDPYFSRERRQRINRERNNELSGGTIFGIRPTNGNRVPSDNLHINHHSYIPLPNTFNYNVSDDESTNATSLSSSSNNSVIDENSQQIDNDSINNNINVNVDLDGASYSEDNNDDDDEEDQLNDVDTTVLTIPIVESGNDEQNKTNTELEDGEIPTVEPPQYIQELVTLSTQIRELLNNENILVNDGRPRLLSLLSQINNLQT